MNFAVLQMKALGSVLHFFSSGLQPFHWREAEKVRTDPALAA